MKYCPTESAHMFVTHLLARGPAPLSKVYLAGPAVFRPDAHAIGGELRALCARYGFEALWPADNRDTLDAQMIFVANNDAIRSSAAVVADISPFRGPHMDPGTAFEIGLAYEERIPVFAYTSSVVPRYPGSDARRPRELLTGRIWAGEVAVEDGNWREEDGTQVENFDLPESLMIAHAVKSISVSPEEAIANCARYFATSPTRPSG